MIDLDYNATTPLRDDVRETMEPYLDPQYGNPSSLHQIGQKARAGVEGARESIARVLEASTEDLVLTASGSEANTLALRGLVRPPYEQREIVTTPVEHSSVRDTLLWLQRQGTTVHFAPVDRHGQVPVEWFESTLHPEVDLVSVMMVNNETGVVFPVEEIGELCRDVGVTMHSDAIQAFGKRPLSYRESPVDLMSVSAHKIGGPKGAACLVVPRALEITPLIIGCHLVRDRRGGTEDVASVVGFGEAVQHVDPGRFSRVEPLRNQMEQRLQDELEGIHVVGKETRRVANTLGIMVEGVKGEDVVIRLDMKGVAAATGAACTSGSSQPSHVIDAMPLTDTARTDSFVRLSLPPDLGQEQAERAIEILVDTIQQLRTTSVTDQRFDAHRNRVAMNRGRS